MTNGKFVDLTGKRFFDRIIVGRAKKPENVNNNNVYWECLCDCGHTTIIQGAYLKSGLSKICSECSFKGKDESGKFYGLWKVIKFAYSRMTPSGSMGAFWECECLSCKKTFVVSGHSLRRGASSGCLACRHKSNFDNGEVAFNSVYLQYKNGAKKRNLIFDIEKNFLKKITKQNCHYCGCEPSQIMNYNYTGKNKSPNGIYIYNGIDRIDNEIGYVESNCVPSCGICNKAKLKMSELEFYNWIDKTYINLKNNNNFYNNLIGNIESSWDIHLYAKYKNNAKRKDNIFQLSLDQFVKIIHKPCAYCGGSANENGRKYGHKVYYCNGIDRKDSKLGYIQENCVPCCSKCNYAKRDVPEQEFIDWVFRVYHHIHRNDNIAANPEEVNIQVSLPVYEEVHSAFTMETMEVV
jgi:hypothetical protein